MLIDLESAVANRISAAHDAMPDDDYQDALAAALGRVVAPQQFHTDTLDDLFAHGRLTLSGMRVA